MAYANLAAAVKRNRTTQIVNAIGNGGFLQLWTTTAPPSPDQAPQGILLAALPLASPPAVASYGVSRAVITAPGSGGVNGQYGLSIVGDGTGAVGYFSVSGGMVSEIVISSPGKNFTTAPTLTGFGNASVTGASAIAVMTGTLVFNTISTANAIATGNAGWARICTSSSVGVLDLDVGINNGFSVVMDNTFITSGGPVTCLAQVLIEA